MSDIQERDWLDVTIVSTYVDRGNVIQSEVRLLKDEAEAEMREIIRERVPEDADAYHMSNDEFQSRIYRAIQAKLATPLEAKSGVTNEVRLLPPSAYREVIIRVNNLGKVLEA